MLGGRSEVPYSHLGSRGSNALPWKMVWRERDWKWLAISDRARVLFWGVGVKLETKDLGFGGLC
jgi:hypothetical protein